MLYIKFITDNSHHHLLHQSAVADVLAYLKQHLTKMSHNHDVFVVVSLCDSSYKTFKTRAYIDAIQKLPQTVLLLISNHSEALIRENKPMPDQLTIFSVYELDRFVDFVLQYTTDIETDFGDNTSVVQYKFDALKHEKQAWVKIYINSNNICVFCAANSPAIFSDTDAAFVYLRQLLQQGNKNFTLMFAEDAGQAVTEILVNFCRFFDGVKRKKAIRGHYYLSKMLQWFPVYKNDVGVEISRITPVQFVGLVKKMASLSIRCPIKRLGILKICADANHRMMSQYKGNSAEFFEYYTAFRRKNTRATVEALYLYGSIQQSRSDFIETLVESKQFHESQFCYYSEHSPWYRSGVEAQPASEVLYRAYAVHDTKPLRKGVRFEGKLGVTTVCCQIHELVPANAEVLLVFPKSVKNIRVTNPLSLSMPAGYLVKQGVAVEILDERNEPDIEAAIQQRIVQGKLRCIGVTSFTGHQLHSLLHITRFAKSIGNVPIIMGGVHATLFPEQCLKEKSVDYVLTGEGEKAMPQFLKYLSGEVPVESVAGLVFVNKGKVVKNPNELLSLDMAYELPVFLILKKRYKYSHIFFETARGCVYRCSFCAVAALCQNSYRPKPIAQALHDIKRLTQAHPNAYYHFTDDNFLTYLPHTKRFLEKLIEKKKKGEILFKKAWIQCRADTLLKLNGDILQLLKEAGLTEIFIGAESGSNRMLQLLNKRLTVEQIIEANRKMAKHKAFVLQYSFMTNLPTETDEEKQQTRDLIAQLLNENPNACVWEINNYVPYPGTELYNNYYQGQIPDTMEEWASLDLYHGEEKLDIEAKKLY